MEFDLIIQILAVVALATFIVVSIVAVKMLAGFRGDMQKVSDAAERTLQETTKAVKEIEVSLKSVTEKTVGSLEHIDDTARQLTKSTRNIEREAMEIGQALEPYKMLLRNIHGRVASPLSEAATVLTAVSKAVTTFSRIFFKHK